MGSGSGGKCSHPRISADVLQCLELYHRMVFVNLPFFFKRLVGSSSPCFDCWIYAPVESMREASIPRVFNFEAIFGVEGRKARRKNKPPNSWFWPQYQCPGGRRKSNNLSGNASQAHSVEERLVIGSMRYGDSVQRVYGYLGWRGAGAEITRTHDTKTTGKYGVFL